MCALSERSVADGALGNAILEVGIHVTESELMAHFVARLLECIVKKSSIVAVIMLNFHAMIDGEALKGAFGGNGFGG